MGTKRPRWGTKPVVPERCAHATHATHATRARIPVASVETSHDADPTHAGRANESHPQLSRWTHAASILQRCARLLARTAVTRRNWGEYEAHLFENHYSLERTEENRREYHGRCRPCRVSSTHHHAWNEEGLALTLSLSLSLSS